MTHSILRHPDPLVLLSSLGNKDKSLVTHALSVCTLSLAFGRFLGFDSNALAGIGMGALLHDIGELKLPDKVLRNAVNASTEERELLEQHTAIGAVMLKKLKGMPENVVTIVHDHHERADGSGYPRRLTGPDIGLHTKVVSIADTYDSITHGLHGYPGMKAEDALKCIYTWRRDLFDELLVENFIQCIGIYPLGSVVELRSGQVGIVISSRPEARLFPKVLLVLNASKEPVEPPQLINLDLFRERLDTHDFEVKGLLDAARYNIDVRQYVLRELPLG
jgi:putative nucleotidyltransferase with HDIG domain